MSEYEFQSEINSPIDRFLRDRMVAPLASKIPARITPNSITLTTPLFTLSALALAFISREAEPVTALWQRLLAGALCFGSLISDHLDGAHARNTGQSSKLGEILDHWLDALNVPVLITTLIIGVGTEGPVILPAIVSASMLYHAQLFLYHRSGKYVYPKVGGVGPQAAMSIGLALLGIVLHFVPGDASWLPTALIAFSIIVSMGELDSVLHYVRHPQGKLLPSVVFAGINLLWVLPLLLGRAPDWVTVLGICVLSLRASGLFVLRSVLKKASPWMDMPSLLIGLGVAGGTLADAPGVPLLVGASCVLLLVAMSEFVSSVRALSRGPSSP